MKWVFEKDKLGSEILISETRDHRLTVMKGRISKQFYVEVRSKKTGLVKESFTTFNESAAKEKAEEFYNKIIGGWK